jgi:hypothetical protein
MNVLIVYYNSKIGSKRSQTRHFEYDARSIAALCEDGERKNNAVWGLFGRAQSRGSISIALLVFTLTLTTLLGILVLSIKQTNTTLIHYQRYLHYYYNADAALKRALTRLTDIPTRDELPTKAWCYENSKRGLEINPFGHSKVYLFRYLNTIIAISQTAPERLILLGQLNETRQAYLCIYAYDSKN